MSTSYAASAAPCDEGTFTPSNDWKTVTTPAGTEEFLDDQLDEGADFTTSGQDQIDSVEVQITCVGGETVETPTGAVNPVQPMINAVHHIGTKPVAASQQPTPTTPRPGPTATPTVTDSVPIPTATPTPTPTTVATQLELEPTYYDEPDGSADQNLLATGALAGALITASAVIVGAILYRRYFRDRIKYRSR